MSDGGSPEFVYAARWKDLASALDMDLNDDAVSAFVRACEMRDQELENWLYRNVGQGTAAAKSWAGSGSDTLSASGTYKVTVSCSGNTGTVLAIATARIGNVAAGTGDVTGVWFQDASALLTVMEHKTAWSAGDGHTMSVHCTFDAPTSIGFEVRAGGSCPDFDVDLTVTLVQLLDHDGTPICVSAPL